MSGASTARRAEASGAPAGESDGPEPAVSVLLPVYAGDDAPALDAALASMAEQTRPAEELLVVRDGPVPGPVERVLDRWRGAYPGRFRIVGTAENRGLGNALRVGVERCSHGLVARMDADDVSVADRLETQVAHLRTNPGVDVLGGYVGEFTDDPADIDAVRRVPRTHEEISRFARFRSPMNHATVVFRRDRVLAAGNYRRVDPLEDYDLWVRLLLDGATFANVPRVLVRAQAGPDLYERRGGLGYARAEFRRQVEFLDRGFLDGRQFARNLVTRVPVRLVPRRVRRHVYQQFRTTGDPV